jgi:hypothetical protein
MEIKISICKVLFEMFDKLDQLSSGIQTLKTSWGSKLLQMKIAKSKEQLFTEKEFKKYLNERSVDPVRRVWEKSKALREQQAKVIYV